MKVSVGLLLGTLAFTQRPDGRMWPAGVFDHTVGAVEHSRHREIFSAEAANDAQAVQR